MICTGLRATHIVGGVIYYEYLGGNRYKITFEVYRDCSREVRIGFDGSCNPANPACQLPPLYFSVFQGNSNFTPSVNGLLLLDTVLINPVITNPCLEPNGTCVTKGRYETIISLPDNNVGYMIQHQRCCRNNGIANIQNQPGTNDKPGITLRTYIPPTNPYRNNSAIFKNFPPVFICANQQFYFDHSATDRDGDELRYSIQAPLTGLSSSIPSSSQQTLNAPPVMWTPPYSIDNVMGGTPPMSIDSITGQLYCNPSAAGRYVVSIMVKEIRNGIVIDSFARDFQYNVVTCDIPFADAPFIPGTYDPATKTGVYIRCGDLSVPFQNKSTNAERYEWNFGDPLSSSNVSTQVNPTHNFSDTGVYLVTLVAFKTKSNGRLCKDTTRRICYIYPKPKVAFDMQPVCQGTPALFIDQSTSNFGAITGWSWNFAGQGTSRLQNPNFTFQNAGTFAVKLEVETKGGQCKSDTTINALIYPKPAIDANVPKACIGQPLNLICNVTVPSPASISSYRWTLPDGTTFTSCNASLTPTSMANGTVNLWAQTSQGCVDSKDFTYQVFPLPNITASNDITICPGTSTTLTANGGIQYLWTPSTFLSATNVQSPLCTPENPMRYIVKGTDVNGCYNFDTVQVNLFPRSFIDAGRDTSVCLSSSSPNFRTSVQLNGQGTFVSQLWSPPTFLSNPNILNPLATPTSNMTYVLSGVDANRCVVTDSVRVIALDPAINPIDILDTFMCQLDTIQLEAKDQGTITDYVWSPSNPFVITNPNTRNPLFHPLDTLIFTVRLSNYCYTITDNVTLNVNQLPDPGIPKLDSICVGNLYQHNALAGHISYLWTTDETSFSNKNIRNPTSSPSVTQLYLLTVEDKYGCKNTDSMELRVYYPPALSVLGIPRYLCLGDSAELTAYTTQACTYIWRDSSTLSSGHTRSVFAFPWDTTRYTVRATNIHQCSSTEAFEINVQQKIIPQADRPVRICKGKFKNLRASGGLYYLWKPNYAINDTITDTPQVSPSVFTTYTVRISNDCFTDSIKVDVFVDTLPSVDAGIDTTIYRGQEIELVGRGQAERYRWYPTNDLISNPFQATVHISPRDTTLYYFEATNGRGCIGLDSVLVSVFGKNVLLIPSGFTPNADGVNDGFGIMKHLNIRTLSRFEVFNRWGEIVYSTNSLEGRWDGTYKNKIAPAGVYVWQVEAVNFDNEKIRQSGNVTLIR